MSPPTTTVDTAPTGRPFPSRLRSIDLLRGVAVVGMVLTHAADAFLADSFRQGDLWYAADILFGFVGPTFLFAAGLTLWIALERRRSADRNRTTARLLGRGTRLLLIGYWLQIPVLSLRQLIWNHRPDELARLFDANVLQVIASTSIAIVLLTHLLRSIDTTRRIALTLGVCIAFATAYLWQGTLYRFLPLPLGPYLSPQPIASFPLAPFAVYLLLGFAWAPSLLKHGRAWRGIATIFSVGTIMMGGGLLADLPLRHIPPYDVFWGASVQYILFRIGGLVVVTAVCMAIAGRRWNDRSSAIETHRPRTWLERAGENSLAIYVLHLMLIYGSPVTMGMRWWLGGSLDRALSPVSTLLIAAAVVLLCGEIAQGWKWIGATYPRLRLWAKWGWWGIFWTIFLLKP